MEPIIDFLLVLWDGYGWEVVKIAVVILFGRLILRWLVNGLVGVVKLSDGDNEKLSARINTLGHVAAKTGKVVIYLIAVFLILDLFGIDLTVFVAGAGVIGLAVGFGSQSLVKDVVSGIFILLEDQYGIGDKVKIGLFEGEVVKVTMRSTVLRDEDGNVYYISNGLVKNVINKSRNT